MAEIWHCQTLRFCLTRYCSRSCHLQCLVAKELFVMLVTGDVRLVGGSNSFTGQVQVFYDGQWGVVCDDEWDIVDGNVVCRQLGFQQAARVGQNSHFSNTTHRFWMDDVRCSGNESRLADCVFDGWGMNECDSDEHASVECAGWCISIVIESSNELTWGALLYCHTQPYTAPMVQGALENMKDVGMQKQFLIPWKQ